jgi:AcrR family transcriptional regulator
VIRSCVGGADSPWSPREVELLAATLELLQEHGYDRLTLDAVAATARASKATLYRRWPTKADLVTAAFVESTRHTAECPDTGTLRGDLLRLAESMCAHMSANAGGDARVSRGALRPGRRAPQGRDEAIELANDSPYGLGSAVFTRDEDEADYVANRLEVGMVGVNTTIKSAPDLPFGGVKN